MFQIEYTSEALADLRYLRKYEQTIVVTAIEEQLRYEPTLETRNQKQLRPNPLSEWELRVENCRVFYDIDLAVECVIVKAVGNKEHNQLLIRGRQFNL